MKTYIIALAASCFLQLTLVLVPAHVKEVPPPRIVKLGVQLMPEQLASRRQLSPAPESSMQTPDETALPEDRAEALPTKEPESPKAAHKARSETKPENKPELKLAQAITENQAFDSPEISSVPKTPAIKPDKPADKPVLETVNAEPLPSEGIKENPANSVPQEKTASTNLPPVSAMEETRPEENILAPRFQLGSLENPKPAYPALARRRGWEGDVIIGVHVAEDGSVGHLEIMKSSHFGPLDHAAWETVKNEWTFEPALSDGKQVAAFVEVPISFRLSQAQEQHASR